ncbi:hypothetical protein [Streptosporangium sp. NPDC049376]|uniref:hypothetical protein n=1 Tax=Streptosporangium sp. NPDC049376 TaxID=3366192 RepID=UPI00378793F1
MTAALPCIMLALAAALLGVAAARRGRWLHATCCGVAALIAVYVVLLVGLPVELIPLAAVAVPGRFPVEWREDNPLGLYDRYTCVYFRPEDNPGPDEPTPIPDPPNQLTLCPREPYERPGRMFVDTKPVEVKA